MSGKALLKVSVSTTPEAEESVGLVMEKVLGQAASAYTSERTKITTVSVYCAKKSDWTSAKQRALSAGLREIRQSGLRLGSGRITVQLMPKENWAESWKRHFKPIQIGRELLVKPSWSRIRPLKGQSVITLDPGLSFGTGHHATTSFCLQQLARCRKRVQPQSFLDIGTGSGILAIAAARLGYAPVEGFDFDPEAVRVALENGRINEVHEQVQLWRQDLTKLPLRTRWRFDFVCANLISNVLVAEKKRIINRVRPGGLLVLAGILKREFGGVQRAFEAAGMRFLGGKNEKEWRSGLFERLDVRAGD